ncbi:MAG: hypothetical protein GY869_00115 [Planctomycetes bacterium]|nr:hypothetical protein [Planctomycetota bacterium]
MFERSSFRKYLLPGFVFQSVIIGGGYGTGRELVSYFLKYGPLGGLLGMLLVTMVVWSVFLALTFEFARVFRAYDYRTFFRELLGPLWVLFEITFIVYMLIVVGVVGAASGAMFKDYLDFSFMNPSARYVIGVVLMLAVVGFLTFKGSKLIEKFLSIWSFLLYGVYAVFFVVTFIKIGPVIRENFANAEIGAGWHISGFKYAFYNLATVPGVLFCLRHLETRKEAVTAGLLAGPIGIIPAVLFFIPLSGYYPEALAETVPSAFVFKQTGITVLFVIFQIILFGTLVETGTALIHSVNERVESAFKAQNKVMPQKLRPILGCGMLVVAVGISMLGLETLIDKGYGYSSWGFLFIYLIPLATWGIFKIKKAKGIR